MVEPGVSTRVARYRWIRVIPRRSLALDIVIAGLFFLLLLLVDSGSPATVLVLVGFAAALAVRRFSPALALTLAWLAATGQMLAGEPVLGGDVAVLAVLYVTAAYAGPATRRAGLISVAVGALVAGVYLAVAQRGVGHLGTVLAQGDIGALVWSTAMLTFVSLAVLGLSWTLGLLKRSRQAARDSRFTQYRAEEEQRQAQRAVVVEQERNRIARDMHDVVAHSLAVVIAQADGARYSRAKNPDAVDEALITISTTAREALGDVRILLARLRQDVVSGPQPVLADLDRLVEQMRGTGLDIHWTTTGTPATLGSGAQLAVYRIVQEALTNALRHGDTSRTVALRLDWTTDWVAVTINNALRIAPSTVAPGVAGVGETHAVEIGHGLPGMRERALLAGGSLTAEPDEGYFRVAAHLPAIMAGPVVRPVQATDVRA
ncbi:MULTISPECIES: sensor histidine kinase [unclassified Cryobacterium]|uniref:sensor histidine kinase n=1 Tax=unclassified Cryobacterium TaxID=2649013 RepID=UPI002AB35791|nr:MULTISPECIES: histidine kinase [unclassified Cryobacterium]MDY7527609.1 histidine kinase [Cryobacterium sp. 10C2]MDY7556611.1 histidine kinase [Cryobacterium sp. 10C3]MEB0002780.1 histidine kinase [Cryobacterium sp. RTC2.1]MEB0200592.1 histidine kinase [Cryobacterium sp. 5I3]MEB0286938.1 histidine kinase [Cryobacterium sp. 10S3]